MSLKANIIFGFLETPSSKLSLEWLRETYPLVEVFCQELVQDQWDEYVHDQSHHPLVQADNIGYGVVCHINTQTGVIEIPPEALDALHHLVQAYNSHWGIEMSLCYLAAMTGAQKWDNHVDVYTLLQS